MTFGDMGTPGPLADKVMHGQLETTAGYTIMGADTPDEMPFTPGNTVTVSLSGDDTEELNGYWTALIDGGQVVMPLEKQMWGDTFGMCTDKFGTAWMVNIAGDGTGGAAAAETPADPA